MHPVNVLGAGLDADQDDLAALRLEGLGLVAVEHDLAGGRAGRRRQPGRDDVLFCVGIDGRMEELVESGWLDAHAPLPRA